MLAVESLQVPNGEYTQFLKVLGALGRLVVLSMVLERGLAVIFEHDWFRLLCSKRVADPLDPLRTVWRSRVPGLQGTVALVAALAVCHFYGFDVLAAIFGKDPDGTGITLTGLVAAGGSAGAITLFQGFLGMSREAREAAMAARRSEGDAAAAGAQAALVTHRANAEAVLQGRALPPTIPAAPIGGGQNVNNPLEPPNGA